jgi:hypothetical protein
MTGVKVRDVVASVVEFDDGLTARVGLPTLILDEGTEGRVVSDTRTSVLRSLALCTGEIVTPGAAQRLASHARNTPVELSACYPLLEE